MTCAEIKKELKNICPDAKFSVRKGTGTVTGYLQISLNYGNSLKESLQRASTIHAFMIQKGVRYHLTIGSNQ